MTEENQDSLNVSRIELQKVADFLPYPFIIAEIIDGEHLNTHLNEKFIEEIGYSLDEIPTIEAWYSKAYPDADYRNKVIAGWNQEEIESRHTDKISVKMKSLVTCKNGAKRWYQVKASVINAVHVVSFVDLDKEVKLQEELKAINQNNDRMLSILGHDLRSPVASLMSISSLAASTDITNSEFVELINMVNERSTHVLELLDNTLNWARLNFNDIKLNPVEIDFEVIVSSILSIYKTTCQDKNIAVNVDTSEMLAVTSDSEVVTIIIRNLLSNAIKFTGKDGAISITASEGRLRIKDSGIGMSAAMIDEVFSNSHSGRKGTNDEEGTGLGLQLVTALADKINCRITIESKEFCGTSIYLTFK
jgi:signal transduction histidine kinase